MRRIPQRTALSLAVLLAAATAFAQPGVSYPRVFGPTGSLYGPTQAHYQYLRQYGRPWVSPTGAVQTNVDGAIAAANGGIVPTVGVPYGVRYPAYGCGFPYGYGAYNGYGSYYGGLSVNTPFVSVNVGRGVGVTVPGVVGYGAAPVYGYGYESFAPVVRQAHPLWIGQDPFDNEVLARAKLEEQIRWREPIVVPKVTNRPRLAGPAASSEEMKARSLKHRVNGDTWFRKQQYSTALNRYKIALQEAPDVAENQFRVGFALVAANHPDKAIAHFKEGVEIDPLQPQIGTPLAELFGPENALAKSSFILRAADWVREDIRDPDRLFVMGVLLHFDDQEEKASEFFETAYRLTGRGDHLLAFLQLPEEQPVAVAPAPGAAPAPAHAPRQDFQIPPALERLPEPQPAPAPPPANVPDLGGVEKRLDNGPELPFPPR